MEVLLAIRGSDFVLCASNKAAVRGVTIIKDTDDKTRKLNDHNLLLYSGEAGDTVQFAGVYFVCKVYGLEYIQANVRLYGMRNDCELNPEAVSSFTRRELADSLRSRKPYQVNLLLAGYDTVTNKAHLHWIDYLGASVAVPYAAHGYAAYYCMSIFDRYHRPDITSEEAADIMEKCFQELEKRLPLDVKGFNIHIVSKNGISMPS